jgi:hypothetical protein
MDIYKDYIPMKGMRWGWVFEKFASAGSDVCIPRLIPGGVWRFFWYPTHTGPDRVPRPAGCLLLGLQHLICVCVCESVFYVARSGIRV